MGPLKNILVIDDDQAVRETICENLRDSGFAVLEAAGGGEGLGMLEALGAGSIVITDIIMPEMNGLDVIRAVRKRRADVKIIAISGGRRTETEDFLESAQRLGAQAAFPKPVDLDRLEGTIKNLCA